MAGPSEGAGPEADLGREGDRTIGVGPRLGLPIEAGVDRHLHPAVVLNPAANRRAAALPEEAVALLKAAAIRKEAVAGITRPGTAAGATARVPEA